MSPSQTRIDTVVVVGGSIAGLLAAAAAAPHARRVLVLDRDRLPDEPAARPGTPQCRHTHGLLASGRESIEQLLPGFTAEVLARGGHSNGDIGRIGRWYVGGGLLADCNLGTRGIGVSRATVEHVVRERVRALPNVEIRDESDVAGLVGQAGRVTGVRIRGSRDGGAGSEIAADLVVDASGRSGRAARWLPELGLAAPVEERIKVGIRYLTVHVEARPDDVGGRQVVASAAVPPVPRVGVAIRQEDGTWSLTLGTYAEQPIPVDPDGLRAFAASLVSPDLVPLLTDRPLLHEALTYRFPDCRRRRFAAVPPGYAPIGDALCSLDPTFGQGMSVAALQAAALAELMAGGSDAIARDYPARADRIVDIAWTVVRGTVLGLPGVEGTVARGEATVGRYVRRLQRVARQDPVVSAAFMRVMNLLAPPASLMKPAIAVRVLRPRRAAVASVPSPSSSAARAVPAASR
ncbi:MAG TPA: FAD-dependent oxidoreductase [Nakamurella sp.]